jgi:AcrR family transcriptional regulator
VSTTTRGERTRRLIVERTAPVFGQQGFAAASLSQLVASTGLTRGAFYFHFDSKDALAAAITEAQADRWEQLREEVEAGEGDPFRRLIGLNMTAATRYRSDAILRAAARLLTEGALIRYELPKTAPWWIGTIEGYLREADRSGELQDLSSLVRPGARTAAAHHVGLRLVCENLVALWAALPTAAAASGLDDLPDRLHATYAVMLPRLCAKPERVDELLEYVELLAQRMEAAAAHDAEVGEASGSPAS